MDLKPTTIILLIDFEGHPALGSEHTNYQRYSTLAWLLNTVREKPLIIISNHNPEKHKRTEEVAKMMKIENRQIWKTVHCDSSTIESIKIEVRKMGYEINNIIIGGTNTSGCVFRNKPISAINWAKLGYNVQVLSTMCADYQITGTNATEQTQNALSVVWRDVAEAKLFDKIRYIRDYECQII
jgi:nicotinamidase-related amidase